MTGGVYKRFNPGGVWGSGVDTKEECRSNNSVTPLTLQYTEKVLRYPLNQLVGAFCFWLSLTTVVGKIAE